MGEQAVRFRRRRLDRPPLPCSALSPLDHRPFWRRWGSFAALGLGLLALGAALGIPVLVHESPSFPDGGLLFFVDHDGEDSPSIAADTSVEMWRSGAGNEILRLQMELDPWPAGSRWYVVTSGQLRVDTSDISMLCSVGGFAHRQGDVISCDGDRGWGDSRDVEYRLHERLVAIAHDGRSLQRLSDYEGYIDDDATVVTGVFREASSPKLVVWLASRPLVGARIGADTEYALASMFQGNLGDYGASQPPLVALDEPIRSPSGLAVLSTRQGLASVAQRTLQVELPRVLGTRRVSWADPVPTRANRLYWRTAAGGLGSIRFVLHDPVESARQALRTFLSGVVISAGLSVVLVTLERWIEHTARSRRT